MEQNSTTQQPSTQPPMPSSTVLPQQNPTASPSTSKTPISSLTEDLSNMNIANDQSVKAQIIPAPQETDEKIADKINSQTQLPLVGNKTFVQKKQQTPVYHYPKNTTESPIYNYFADGQKYLHQDESAQERNYFMKGSESPNKPMQTGKKDGVQTPNYRDFDFFNQHNSPEKVTSPNKMTQLPFQMKNAFNMDDFQTKQMNFNNNMGLKKQGNNFHIDLNNDDQEEEEDNEFDQEEHDDNDFNPLGMKGTFNMKGMNNFGNMRQNNQDFALLMNNMNNQGNSMGMLNMNMNGMNQMGQGQMSNQNMNMMPPYFGNDFMNQQQQMNIGKLNKEDYLFEKFGKRGWQCIRCNNFNFESNIILYNLIARNKCNKCGLPMTPKLINKNRRDDFFNPDDKKKKPLIERKGDWLCPKCRNLNFAFRLICNRCQLPKSDAGGQMPFQNNMGNQRGFNPQNQNSNFNFKQGNNFPSSLLNPSNINIYNNYYNFSNLKTDVGNGNSMLSYMNKINGPQKDMGMNDGSPNFGNFSQFSNFDPKSLENIINNPHSMKPGDFNLNKNLHQHDLDNEEDDSSEDDGEEQHHI